MGLMLLPCGCWPKGEALVEFMNDQSDFYSADLTVNDCPEGVKEQRVSGRPQLGPEGGSTISPGFMNESADMRRPRLLVNDQLSSLIRNNVLTNVNACVNKSQSFTKMYVH